MGARPEAYGGRFADVKTGLEREVGRGMALIEELLQELDSTKAALKQTKLDLDNECDARRRLQQAVHESREWEQRQGRRPFMVALIDADADCYVFPDRFITKGKEGGEAAADALLAALQQYMHEMTGQANGMDVLVRAFANVSGLGQALELGGRLKNATQLREFATGFSRRQAFFDFVDVGDGKERADFKVRESTKFFLESFQCKHLVLACGHDAGYAPFLGQFAGDQQVADRITLLEVSPFPRAIRELGLKKTQFGSVFGRIAQPAVSSALVGPLTWGRVAAVTAEAAATPLASRRNSIERPVAAAAAAASPPASPQTRRHSPQAESNRLGPVLVGEDGRRIDRRLHVNTAIVEKLRKVSLCYHLFLRGECVMPKCPRTHWVRQLTNEEFDALWWLARQGQCYTSMNGKECSDATCVYSHATKEV